MSKYNATYQRLYRKKHKIKKNQYDKQYRAAMALGLTIKQYKEQFNTKHHEQTTTNGSIASY